ncbi:MAG: hypothetical protein ACRD44_05315 [Bryobacteraceae bacterium]
MRSDSHKVIVERPRLGSRLTNRKTAMRLRAGILVYAESRRWRPPEGEGNLVRVSEDLEFQKEDGLWFRVEYRTVDQTRMLEARRQCDRKTIRQIERGDWGEIVARI